MTTSVSNSSAANNPISALQKSTGSGTSGSDTGKVTTAEDMQTRFLNLLMVQLKNQDPLNPMDNAQMTTQMSQISTVSGIEKLNATMGKLLDSYTGSQNMQAAAMIGKSVLTEGSSLQLGATGAVGGVDLATPSDKVVISIKDASGKVVNTQNLGAQPAGALHFAWDGKDDGGVDLPDGNYSFSVTAKSGNDPVEAKPLAAGTVTAITLAKDGMSLQLGSGKTVGYSDVKQILN